MDILVQACCFFFTIIIGAGITLLIVYVFQQREKERQKAKKLHKEMETCTRCPTAQKEAHGSGLTHFCNCEMCISLHIGHKNRVDEVPVSAAGVPIDITAFLTNMKIKKSVLLVAQQALSSPGGVTMEQVMNLIRGAATIPAPTEPDATLLDIMAFVTTLVTLVRPASAPEERKA